MTKYRIVTDSYLGYEVQEWRWFWPFWMQTNGVNTQTSIESAEALIRHVERRVVKRYPEPKTEPRPVTQAEIDASAEIVLSDRGVLDRDSFAQGYRAGGSVGLRFR